MTLPVDSVLDIQSRERAIVATATTNELTHESSLQFQQQLEAAVTEAPELALVVDLNSVVFMPSLALGILVSINKKLQQSGRRCFLVGVQPDVLDVITVTGLQKLFDIRPSVDDALQQL